MRLVNIYLTIANNHMNGWRMMLLVEEGQTRVTMLDPTYLRVVGMKRSVFEAARSKQIPLDYPWMRAKLAAAIENPPLAARGTKPKASAMALARYALFHLNHRCARFDMEIGLGVHRKHS